MRGLSWIRADHIGRAAAQLRTFFAVRAESFAIRMGVEQRRVSTFARRRANYAVFQQTLDISPRAARGHVFVSAFVGRANLSDPCWSTLVPHPCVTLVCVVLVSKFHRCAS